MANWKVLSIVGIAVALLLLAMGGLLSDNSGKVAEPVQNQAFASLINSYPIGVTVISAVIVAALFLMIAAFFLS